MDDLPVINIALYAQTDAGIAYSGNEDNFLALDLSTGSSWTANGKERNDLLTYRQGSHGSLLAVSDGVGGAMAVEMARDRMPQLQEHSVLEDLYQGAGT